MFDEKKEIKVQLKKWQPTVEEFGVPYIDFKSDSFVALLKVKDMNSLYIRSKEKDHFELFFMFWDSIAAYCFKNCNYFIVLIINYKKMFLLKIIIDFYFFNFKMYFFFS